MVTNVSDSSSLSQEILQSTPGELSYALWDMVASTCLRPFRLYGDQASGMFYSLRLIRMVFYHFNRYPLVFVSTYLCTYHRTEEFKIELANYVVSYGVYRIFSEI